MQKSRRPPLPDSHAKRLARSSQVGLSIDSYEDLFSDFDPRPYKEKQLSEDFLTELRRFFFDKNPDYLDLVFLIPKRARSATTEAVIKRRLHIFFHKRRRELEQSLRRTRKLGLLKVLVSVILMVFTGYLATRAGQIVWLNIIKVILEPASWFLFWTSLEQLLSARGRVAGELGYYNRLAECKIVFLPI